ncbi:pentapeptide repeat-containing protein [Pseudonocardia broussonetiae]|uniref:pentapeptide repeat-containing protein n=1 Tax=Pseudonocardia broussonetiae TaxID=2736640 RepID=UPI0019641357|nr:pentapeptide repeat-containing protein [Pseudonocardia broussonetiae]
MAVNNPNPTVKPERVLSVRSIVLGSLLLLVVAIASAWALLSFYGGGTATDSARLDAIRTTANIVLGTGGAAALLLAARRQRSTEQTLEHQREVAAATDRDNIERRITELYTKAAEQLGSDKAPVRLAGAYALERLGQNNPDQRELVMSILCAYLRMPFESSPETREEAEVRLAVFSIIGRHVSNRNSNESEKFWPGQVLDLQGARLLALNWMDAELRILNIDHATFDKGLSLRRCKLNILSASGCTFNGPFLISETEIEMMAFFDDADFNWTTAASIRDTRLPDTTELSGNFRVPPDLYGSSMKDSPDGAFRDAPDGWRLHQDQDRDSRWYFVSESN